MEKLGVASSEKEIRSVLHNKGISSCEVVPLGAVSKASDPLTGAPRFRGVEDLSYPMGGPSLNARTPFVSAFTQPSLPAFLAAIRSVRANMRVRGIKSSALYYAVTREFEKAAEQENDPDRAARIRSYALVSYMDDSAILGDADIMRTLEDIFVQWNVCINNIETIHASPSVVFATIEITRDNAASLNWLSKGAK